MSVEATHEDLDSVDAALVSIQPEYAKKVRMGLKNVEYRKGRMQREPELLLFYETEPVGKVTMLAEVDEIQHGYASDIYWGGMTPGYSIDELSGYLEGRVGTAILLLETFDLPDGIQWTPENPPQSYRYIENLQLTGGDGR